MLPRRRVIEAVRHGRPDRVPLDLGSSFTTGITLDACRRLCEAMGISGELELYDVVQQLATVPEPVLERLGVDVRGAIPNVVRKHPTITEQDGVQQFEDEWGITWKRMPGTGYFHAAQTRLSGAITVDDVEEFDWPDPTDAALFEGVVEQAREWHEKGYAVILESICAGVFEMACRVRGAEQFYIDLAMDLPLACALLDKFVELKIRFYEAAGKYVGGTVQFIREGDDLAGQENLLISPQMVHELILPRHRRLYEAQKQLFAEPFFVWLHSCGAVFDMLDDFIAAGVQVLNPVQTTAKGMAADRLKKHFGSKLAFWGGGVDTQHILCHGSPDEVRRDVAERMRILKDGAGFVFATIHNIQNDVPTENLLAMLETFDTMKAY